MRTLGLLPMFAGGGSLTACPSPSVMLPVAKGLGAIMSRHHPWSAFYWDDWATDTAHLSDSEYAIYHRLLTHYYKTQKPLLANATSLLRVCLAFTSDQQAALSSVLSQFFVLKGENYHNKRADSELEKMISISKERQLVGRKGGLAKARNLLQQKAYQNPTHPHPHIQPQSQVQKSKPSASPENGNGHNGESKHTDFKNMIFKTYEALNNGEKPPWNGADAKQLSDLIKSKPDLDHDKFRRWLVNYGNSRNINPAAPPRAFIPRLVNYASGTLNEYGRPADAD
jgi:uncharacterized protein YdaU (DUF1376 family)